MGIIGGQFGYKLQTVKSLLTLAVAEGGNR